MTYAQEKKNHDENHTDVFSFTCPICWDRVQWNTTSITPKTENIPLKTDDQEITTLVTHDHAYCKSLKTFKLDPTQTSCIHCQKSFEESNHLQLHIWLHHESDVENSDLYLCETCGIDFNERSVFKDHIFQHVNDPQHHMTEPSIDCLYCGQAFQNQLQFNKHMLKHKKDIPFPCKMCGQSFANREFLQNHLRRHRDTEKKLDSECNTTIAQSGFFPCIYCRAHLISIGRMQQHIWKFHVEMVEKHQNYFCLVCPYITSSRDDFQKHVFKGHTNTKETLCPKCNKKMSSQYLGKHLMVTHSIEKPFICMVCQESFKSLSVVHCHMTKKHTKKELWKILT